MRWDESDRETLGAVLPEAVVVLPVGATEQHGPRLATGTDALLATEVCRRAVDRADSPRRLVLAPTLSYGASDHHLPFGATLSLTAETMLAVLLDLARSVAECGGRRLVLVNGHGGNTGLCQAAAAAASVRYDLAVAHADYWRLLPDDPERDAIPVPGHAGAFEASLLAAARPDLAREHQPRGDAPAVPGLYGMDLHSADSWQRIDGYTDRPDHADAAAGERWLEQAADALAARLADLARVL
jgi:creatinine amidohydrolase